MADAGVTDAVQWKKRDGSKIKNDHVLRKRLPPRLPRRKQDIYITNKSNYKGQLARSEKLLESGEPEIVIHGLGAAVTRAVNLALQLKEKFLGTVELSVNTSTVDIVDHMKVCTGGRYVHPLSLYDGTTRISNELIRNLARKLKGTLKVVKQ